MASDPYEILSAKIFLHSRFKEDYSLLMKKRFHELDDGVDKNAIKRLVESAAIFSCSSDYKHKSMAGKIATSIIEAYNEQPYLQSPCELIITRLGNLPTVEMAIKEYHFKDYYSLLDADSDFLLPLNMEIEIETKKKSNCLLFGRRNYFVTDFQADLYKKLIEGNSLSISGPTSSGKSFIVKEYAMNKFRDAEDFTAIYIVPTRALITQIQHEFKKLFKDNGLEKIKILTTSWDYLNSSGDEKYKILIMTQERLQYINGNSTSPITANLLIIDEAQKIDDNSRGIALEDMVTQIIKHNSGLQTIFISPYIGNPEKFGKIFCLSEFTSESTRLSPVSQFIYDVTLTNKSVRVEILCQELENELLLFDHEIDGDVDYSYKKKTWVAINLASQGPTIIYCNDADDCRRTCDYITSFTEKQQISNQVLEVIDFLKENVHPQYHLIDYLENGVAYHYSTMPQLAKVCIEALFSNRKLEYICCTSTLMEGVNFPVKNVILHNPRKGNIKMDSTSFWNLVGRCGRLRYDFSGNVFCINKNEWPGYKPSYNQEGQEVKSAMEIVLTEKKELLINYLKNDILKGKIEVDVEAAVTRFIIAQIRKENKEFIGQLVERSDKISKEDLYYINSIIKTIESQIQLEPSIIMKNQSIDPRLQNRLYLEIKNGNNPPRPLHPMAEKYLDSLIRIIEMSYRCLDKELPHKQAVLYAIICKSWTKEKSLREIIHSRLNYQAKKRILTKKEINKLIENTIEMINDIFRYRLCQYIGCYVDIYNQVMDEQGGQRCSENLGYFIEMGAHNPTTLTLINDGIPRNIAVLLAREMPLDIQDIEECKPFILNHKNELSRIVPSIILEEIFSFENEQISRTISS